jgi:hypothetical protein
MSVAVAVAAPLIAASSVATSVVVAVALVALALVALVTLLVVRSIFIIVPDHQRAVLLRFGRVLARVLGRAERERRAEVIAATGEWEASAEPAEAAEPAEPAEPAEAADKLTGSPGALQLRTLQTLTAVAGEHQSTRILPVPVEVLDALRRVGS